MEQKKTKIKQKQNPHLASKYSKEKGGINDCFTMPSNNLKLFVSDITSHTAMLLCHPLYHFFSV